MQHRQLGRSDLSVPVVAFGAWAIGGGPYWGPGDDDAAVEAIRAALDAGIDAIDTAPIYGMGHSERLVGRAIDGRRDEVLLLTKVGLRWDSKDGELFFESTGDDGRPLEVYRNSRPDSVRREVERSLERLATDRLDLVQVHWPDSTTPIAETMGALAGLVREGKIRAVGVSNYDTDMLDQAVAGLGDVPLASVQPKYNLLVRDIERDVLPWARAHDVGVLAYSPLEQGLLTGKVTSARDFGATGRGKRPTFQSVNRDRVNALLEQVVAPVARAHDATLAQVVIAWTVQQPGLTTALVGARRPDQARENAAAGQLVLTAGEWEQIDRAFTDLVLEPVPAD